MDSEPVASVNFESAGAGAVFVVAAGETTAG